MIVPPESAGTVQLTLALPPGDTLEAVTFSGAEGGAPGATGAVATDSALDHWRLLPGVPVAWTVKV